MQRINLASGLLRRESRLLVVRGVYQGEPKPLWTLPGGRQEPGETLAQTVVREFAEEASLHVAVGDIAYVSESVDRRARLHVVNCTFWIRENDPTAAPKSNDPKIVDVRFIAPADVAELLRADVLRIPVAAALDGPAQTRYYAFEDRDIVVPFFTARTYG